MPKLGHQGVQKSDYSEYQTGHSGFPESDQQFCNWELIRQMISDSTAVKFRRLGSSLIRLSSSVLPSSRATNAWAVGASANDVSTLSSLGKGWYVPWAPPSMHFQPGWSAPTEGFGHIGYYTGDDRYGNIGHQQDSRAPRQENRMVRNLKPEGPVSAKVATAPGQQHK
jgi:hypothetical protein